MGYKFLLLFIYALFTTLLFVFFDAAWEVWLSFFVSSIIVTGITVYHIFVERAYSPFLSSYIVFTFLFFLVAPIIQITSLEGDNPKFMTEFPYREGLTVYTNVLICLFNLIFFFGYLFFKKYNINHKIPSFNTTNEKYLPYTILALTIFCVLIFFASYGYVIDEIERPSWKKSDFSISTTLLWEKVFFLIPLGGIILIFQYFKKSNKKAVNLLLLVATLFFLIVLLIWFKNPLTEKRNALGPVYICVMFLFIPKLLNTNIKSLYFLFFAMIIGFPLTAIITHTDASFSEIVDDPFIVFEEIKGGSITTVFNTLNYDAFANIMATIDYVSAYGLSYGDHLASTLLFFVPRSIWEDKPINTGIFIGDYLIDEYGFIFNNLSNPVVSEGYINFGIVGVILFAIILAFFFVKFIYWLKSENYLFKIMAFYFAIHLIYFLRGDLANGFSFYIGALIGVIVIPKMIEWFVKGVFKKPKIHGEH